MSLGKTVAVALVGLLLTASVAGANGVVAAERTVLDADYVTDSLEESGFYEEIHGEMIGTMTEGAGVDTAGLPGGVDTQSIAEEAITVGYVQSQVDSNIERTYEFLHGNREDPELYIDLEPVKENISDQVEAEVRDASLSELLSAADADLSTDRVTVDPSLIDRLTANESSYQAAREDFRAQLREEALEELVNQTMDSRSNEELLLLVMSPSELAGTTEAEREQLVEENEDAIRAELRTEIEERRSDELDQAIDEKLADVNSRAEQLAQESGTDSDLPENVTTAATDLQIALVEGLAGEQSYTEFKGNYDTAKDDLATAFGDYAQKRLDENLPDRHSFSEQMSAEDRAQLDQAASMVQLLDTLALALPILALALIAGLYLITRSLVRTTRTTGSTLLVVGAPAFVIAYWARGNLADMLATAGFEAGESQMGDVLIATADGVLGTIAAQSLFLAVVGLVLFGVAIAYGRGMFDEYLEGDGEEPAEGADEPPEEPAEET